MKKKYYFFASLVTEERSRIRIRTKMSRIPYPYKVFPIEKQAKYVSWIKKSMHKKYVCFSQRKK